MTKDEKHDERLVYKRERLQKGWTELARMLGTTEGDAREQYLTAKANLRRY